jgi:bacitracin synthase 3
MNALGLSLKKLNELDVDIRLVDDCELKVDAPKGVLDEDLIGEIRDNKEELIQFLKNEKKRREFSTILPVAKKDFYSLSSAQKRLFAVQQMDPSSRAYNMPRSILFHKGLDRVRLENTFKELIQRHEILRTSFPVIDEEPVQRIDDNVKFEIQYYNVENEDEKEKIIEDFVRPFNLSEAPLLRVGVIATGEDELLLVDMHHIISDGISHQILRQEFNRLYNDNGQQLPETRLQYKDYSEWQSSEQQQDKVKGQEGFWLKRFSKELPVLSLPTDYPRPALQSFVGNTVAFTLDKSETEIIKSIAAQTDTTLFMVILSLYNTWLAKLTGQEDIIIGTAVAGRRHAEIQDLIGMFANTLAMRNFPSGEKTFLEFLNQVKRSTLDAFENQDYQFEALVQALSITRDVSRHPVFDMVFGFFNQADFSKYHFNEKDAGEYTHKQGISKFDLTLTAVDIGDTFLFKLEYCTKLFKPATIDRFIGYFRKLIGRVGENPQLRLSDIEMISQEEREQLLYRFNRTSTDYPQDKTIHQLFEERVAQMPDNDAVVYKNQRLTYGQLNTDANRLANELRARGADNSTTVGILMDHSFEMITGILGILKSGASYVPIEPNLPQSRVMTMLNECRSPILLTKSGLFQAPSITGFEVHLLDDMSRFTAGEGDENPEHLNQPSDLAYIIFTSGSTGTPKGVMVEHRSLVNLCSWHNREYGITQDDRATKYAGFGFDASVWEIFPYLMAGAELHVMDDEIKMEMSRLNDYFERNQITIAFLPTQICEQFMALDNLSLRILLTGGDKLKTYIPRNYRLVNNYGPTENTVVATCFPVYQKEANLPIGKSIDNTTAYILDKAYRPVPIGVQGELFIGGDGVARGYLNNPELTHHRFLPETVIQSTPGTGRIYATGDLARRLPNGNIEFLGRKDFQVKIRGFRVELAEIETRLLTHKKIKEAVVLAKEDHKGEKSLIAFIVMSDAQQKPDISEIKNFLAGHLPAYMIPTYISELDALPLNTSGKVDRKALHELDAQMTGGDQDTYVAPRSDIETKLAEIWADVLGVEKVGIKDSFFNLGGDSIKAIQVQARMNKFGYGMDIKEIFLNPTILEIAKKLKKRVKVVSQTQVTGNIPLTPIQEEFFRQDTDLHHFNQSVLLYSEKKLEEDFIRRIFETIQTHHDALRMIYEGDEKNTIQKNQDCHYPLSLEVCDLTGVSYPQQELLEKCKAIQASTDPAKAPMMKLGLFHMEDGDRLLIVIHHLVVDEISWQILFEDIEQLSQQYRTGAKDTLPFKTDSFKYWSEQLQEYSTSEKLLEEIPYWETRSRFQGEKIPRDYENRYYLKDSKKVAFSLNKSDTETLLKKVNEAYNTEINDILLTALGLAVKQTFGSTSVSVTMEGHGRESIGKDIDISRTIGWFTSSYPVLLDMKYAHDISRQIKEIKEKLHRIPNKGLGYGILKYITPPEFKCDLDLDIQPQISFNYLGQFDSDIKKMSIFEIADESAGLTMNQDRLSAHDFSITGIIANDRLNITITYGGKQFKPETLECFKQNYEEELKQLIDYCGERKLKQLTPSDFSYKRLSIPVIDQLSEQYDIEDIYPLSPMQEGMLFHSVADLSSQAYLEQVSYRFEGELDPLRVEETLNLLLERYDIFRTLFLSNNSKYERYLQVVLKERKIDFRYEDARDESEENIKQRIDDYRIRDRKNTFLLHEDVLMRVAVFRISDREYQVLWTFHHILMDGWCIGIINKEFFKIYEGLIEGKPVSLPEVTPYKTYIGWLETKGKEESIQYWRNYLADYEEQATLPKDLAEVRDYNYQNEEMILSFNKEKTLALNKWAADNQVTLNTTLQGIWGILLSRYSTKDDVVFGTVVSGRPYQVAGVETMIGLFINTIPVRMRLSDELSFVDLVKSIQMDYINSEPHHYLSLAEIQAETELKNQLLDHLFVFENYPIERSVKELGQVGQKIDSAMNLSNVETFAQTNYDLNIILMEGDNLSIRFRFNAIAYDREYISRLSTHLENVIDQVLEEGNVLIPEIEFISQWEKNQIINEFNDTQSLYPKDKTLHWIFEEQVEKTPDAIALVGKAMGTQYKELPLDENSWLLPDFACQVNLTYKQVNEKANQLARVLRAKNVKPDTVVGILGHRSPEIIIGILAILKAGGAYMPVAPDCPIERTKFMLNDGNVNVLLTQKDFIEDYRRDFETIDLGDPGVYNGPVENLEHVNCPSDLIYVIYTSGSTGRPKGTMAEHKGTVRLVKKTNYYDFNPRHRILQTCALVFDVSIFEMWGALLNGLSLFVYDKEKIINPAYLHKLLKINNITTMWLTTGLCNHMVDEDIEMFSGLSYLLVGGEALCPTHISRLRYRFGDLNIINGYGPTENVSFSTTFNIDKEFRNSVPIGKPISNSTAYIFDKRMTLVPIGVTGELFTGGDGVARGYMNNPELTLDRFIDNPFEPGEKLYKTGDLARWLPDGNIEYLGRIDTQVKLRGFRIELGEIENRISALDEIKEAVVAIKEDVKKNKYLCAFIVTESERGLEPKSIGIQDDNPSAAKELSINVQEINKQLTINLPGYMIPSRYIELDQLPLTSSNKVDRRKLPEPEIITGEDYIAPRNELEKTLVEIWAEVLELKKEAISIDSNFFELGGHSLHATKLLYKIHKELNIEIQLVDIFRSPTIEHIASLIGSENLKNNQNLDVLEDLEEMIL